MSIESAISYSDAPAGQVYRPMARARSSRTILRTIVLDAVIVGVLLIVCELLLQWLAPIYGHDYYDRTLTASQPVYFNADGYRGPSVPLQKQPGEYRIVALGDSTTFGTGVTIEQTWPWQLAERLAGDKPDGHVSVMNVALQGASLADMTVALKDRWSAYHPDAVTVMVSSNMISLAWIHRNEQPQMPPYILHAEEPTSKKEELMHLAGRLCLPHFLSVNTQRALYWIGVTDHRIADPTEPFGALLAHGWRQGNLPPTEADEAWADFATQLKSLHDVTQQLGVKLVVGFSPCRFDMSNSVFDNEKNVPRSRLTIEPAARLAALCKSDGIACMDTLDALRSARRKLSDQRGSLQSLFIMFDYNHLNGDGHAAVANAMLPLLETQPR